MHTLATCIAVCGAFLLSCAETATTPIATSVECSKSPSVSYEDIASGKVAALCDDQHLVAPLAPVGPAPYALGQLRVPLHILKQELRDYCVTDDDGESHHATITRDDGTVVFDGTADESCKTLELPAATYRLTITLAHPSGPDSTGDTFHTRLVAREGLPPKFVIGSNECPGCTITGFLPSDGQTTNGYGLFGNYAGANLAGVICGDPEHRNQLNICTLHGNFTGANLAPITIRGDLSVLQFAGLFDGTTIDVRASDAESQDGKHQQLTILPGSFNVKSLHLDVPDVNCFGGSPAIDELRVNGLMFDAVVAPNENYRYRCAARVTVTASGSDFNERTFDGRYVDGFVETDLRGVNFGHAHFTNFDFGRVHGSPSLDHVNFSFATFDNSTLDASSLQNTQFSGATLRNTSIGPKAAAGWGAPGSSFAAATLENVTFGPNGDFTDGTFAGATIKGMSAAGGTWDRVSFTGATLTSLNISSAISTQGIVFPSKVTALNASNGDWSLLKAPGTVFVNADFSGSDLSDANLTDAQLPYAVLDGTTLSRTNFTNATLTDTRFTCAFGFSTAFTNAHASRATLDQAHFYAPGLSNTDFSNASARTSYLCAAPLASTDLSGTNLRSAFAPSAATMVWEPQLDAAIACQPAQNTTTAKTSELTSCPNGSPGPCSTAAQWQLVIAPPSACAKGDPACAAQGSQKGASCTSPCDCASRHCGANSKCQ